VGAEGDSVELLGRISRVHGDVDVRRRSGKVDKTQAAVPVHKSRHLMPGGEQTGHIRPGGEGSHQQRAVCISLKAAL